MRSTKQTTSLARNLLLKRWLLVIPGVIAFAFTLYAQNNPSWTEHVYSLTWYPVLSSLVGYLPSLIDISLTEWLVLLFFIGLLVYLGYYLVRCITYKNPVRKQYRAHAQAQTATASIFVSDFALDSDPEESSERQSCSQPETLKEVKGASLAEEPEMELKQSSRRNGRLFIVYRFLVGLLAIASVVYVLFTALCGLNYYRYSFTYYTDYTIEQSSVEELRVLCTTLATEVESAKEQLGDIGTAHTANGREFSYYSLKSVEAMEALSQRYPALKREWYSAPKPVIASGFMSDAGIGGVFFPFTLESNINTYPPSYTLPSTMAHELAHQCGFMREDEANFISYLACKESDDAVMRYSGLSSAFGYSISALYRVDPEYASGILGNLSEGVKHDRAQNRAFWASHEGTITEISTTVNDTYLKGNNQVDGVQSYGRMVDLLLAEQRATSDIP